MAAGLGARFGGAKQFERVGPGGESLVEYAVFDARRAGFGRVVLIVGRDHAGAADALRRALPGDLDIVSVVQDPDDLPPGFTRPPGREKPWGTVHAVLAARSLVAAPFAVINADDFYGRDAYALAHAACDEAEETGAGAVIGMPLARTLSPHGPVARAICEAAPGGWLTSLAEVHGIARVGQRLEGRTTAGESRRFTGDELASMNFWALPPDAVVHLSECFEQFLERDGGSLTAELTLPDAVGGLVTAGAMRVHAREAPGPWFGLTHDRDRAHVVESLAALVERGEYPEPLWRVRRA